MSFLDFKNKHYRKNAHKWVYAHEHLTGAVLDELQVSTARTLEEHFSQQDPGSSNSPLKQDGYLMQRLQGESDEAFKERQGIADYTPLFTNGVITLAGLAWSNDRDKTVTWETSALGNPEDEKSIMYKLWTDADGKGTNWNSLLKLATADIISTKEIWALFSGVKRGEDGEALNAGTVSFILPQDVPDWVENSSGRFSEVKAVYETDMRTSIMQEPSEVKISQVFKTDGWIKYSKDKDDSAKEIDKSSYGGDRNEEFRFKTTNDRNTWSDRLPIFRAELPTRANIGYIMARKCNSIYNMENARDFQLWATCFPKAFLDVLNEDKSLNTELYDEIKKAIRDGSNVWPGAGHKFDTPPTEGADIRNATLEMKLRQFLKTFFQVAGDQARERTAAEIKVDFKAGVEAYLGAVVTTLDEIENELYFLAEQVNFPEDPSKWGLTKVKRSTDFSHIDLDAEIDRAIARWVPSGVLPATEDVILGLMSRAAERDRLKLPEEEELRAVVRQSLTERKQSNAFDSELNDLLLDA